MIHHSKTFPAAMMTALFAIAITVTAQESTQHPANWAREIEAVGVKNCFQITTNLYRGAQPTAEAWRS